MRVGTSHTCVCCVYWQNRARAAEIRESRAALSLFYSPKVTLFVAKHIFNRTQLKTSPREANTQQQQSTSRFCAHMGIGIARFFHRAQKCKYYNLKRKHFVQSHYRVNRVSRVVLLYILYEFVNVRRICVDFKH